MRELALAFNQPQELNKVYPLNGVRSSSTAAPRVETVTQKWW